LQTTSDFIAALDFFTNFKLFSFFELNFIEEIFPYLNQLYFQKAREIRCVKYLMAEYF